MGLGVLETFSPSVLRKLTHLATIGVSFDGATQAAADVLELDLKIKRVERLAERHGARRVVERETSVAEWAENTLLDKLNAPPGVKAPAVVCVSCDGGRVQRCDLPETAASHWTETKVGVCLELKAETHTDDPCPQVPTKFLDLAEMEKVTREIKRAVPKGQVFARCETLDIESDTGQDPSAQHTVDESVANDTSLENTPAPIGETVTPQAPTAADPVTAARVVAKPPKVLSRDVVASLAGSQAFGKHLAARAWELGFPAASAKAFVADGSSTNWGIWEREFKHQGYVPILDFIHALTYIFSAAMAGRSREAGAPDYRRWITFAWQGQVLQVIVELAQRAAELGSPPADVSDTDPRKVVAETLTYLTHQHSRMNYPSYRQAGLPVTSSHIESAVKQIGRRVKGSEKFWTKGGAEALLQLRADQLSDTRPLDGFWRRQMEHATGTKPYATRGPRQKIKSQSSA